MTNLWNEQSTAILNNFARALGLEKEADSLVPFDTAIATFYVPLPYICLRACDKSWIRTSGSSRPT